MASLAYHSTTIKHHQPSPLLLKTPTLKPTTLFIHSSPIKFHKTPFRISSESAPKARLVARRKETVPVQQLQRPLLEYMSLPASQYSVLDAERIERVDDNTFRCYVYRFKFFSFEICPVLLVRVEEQRDGCCIKLLSCKLEGSPTVVAQNDKFEGFLMALEQEHVTTKAVSPNLRSENGNWDIFNPGPLEPSIVSALTLIWYGNAASMVNHISCDSKQSNAGVQQLTSDAVIEVSIDVPFPFRAIPVQMIESSGARVLEQILMIMLTRFMAQLVKDYQAWASGDTSRQPLGTGQI